MALRIGDEVPDFTAEEIGGLVAFLASARAAFITGTAIDIDGGASGAV